MSSPISFLAFLVAAIRWLGRLQRIRSDYIFECDLEGRVVPGEGITCLGARFHFELRSGRFSASLSAVTAPSGQRGEKMLAATVEMERR